MLFQNKSFERLMDFRHSGKTLIITTQNMDLTERLCDEVALLDHGCLLFHGKPDEGINRYRRLLNTEKFFVGSLHQNMVFENTKKWADDISCWGKKMGTKEVAIESVELMDKVGRKVDSVASGEQLKIKVTFVAKRQIKDAHFGIAIFRNDGIYCYGPNTTFDKYNISEIKQGKGFFSLYYYKMLIAPGEYRFSVAIWDKNETVAFDYHNGYYKLMVRGRKNLNNDLLNIPFKFDNGSSFCNIFYLNQRNRHGVDIEALVSKWGKKQESEELQIESVRFYDSSKEKKTTFKTNESMRIVINFKDKNLRSFNRDCFLWVGIYRDDGICCQSMTTLYNSGRSASILFPNLPLLPGGYAASVGIWNAREQNFLMYYHGTYHFKMVFNRGDHGTIYLPHRWKWDFKGGRL